MLHCFTLTRKYQSYHYNKQRFFSAVEIENFVGKKNDIFNTFAQNIDCVYTLEPPRRGGSNEYPQSMFWSKIEEIKFYYIKVGLKRIYISRTCYPDAEVHTSECLFIGIDELVFLV